MGHDPMAEIINKFSFQLGLLIRIGFKVGWVHGLGQKNPFPGPSVIGFVFWAYLKTHN